MVKLDTIKEFMHIDNDAEDALLNQFAQAAEEYVKSACGEGVNIYSRRAETVQLMLISDWRENRSLYAQGSYSRAVDSMLMQLRLEAVEI